MRFKKPYQIQKRYPTREEWEQAYNIERIRICGDYPEMSRDAVQDIYVRACRSAARAHYQAGVDAPTPFQQSIRNMLIYGPGR